MPGKHECYAASGRARIRKITSANANNLELFVKDHVEKSISVNTDGWSGYFGLSSKGFHHVPYFPKSPKDQVLELPKVHRILSNLKS